MINYFRYVFSEEELEDILNKKKKCFYNETFYTEDGIKYKVKIIEEGFYIYADNKVSSDFYAFDEGLMYTPMLTLNITENNSIQVYLDVTTNRRNKRDLYIKKIDSILNKGICSEYVIELLSNTYFNNNDEFIELCTYYLAYRLHNKADTKLTNFFINKLDFYGYSKEDFEDKTPFNKNEDKTFLKIVNLALDVLFNYNNDKVLKLSHYKISTFDIRTLYLNYYGFI